MTNKEILDYIEENHSLVTPTYEVNNKLVVGIQHRKTGSDCIAYIHKGEVLIHNTADGDNIGYGVNEPHIVKDIGELSVYKNHQELMEETLDWFYNKGGKEEISNFLREKL